MAGILFVNPLSLTYITPKMVCFLAPMAKENRSGDTEPHINMLPYRDISLTHKAWQILQTHVMTSEINDNSRFHEHKGSPIHPPRSKLFRDLFPQVGNNQNSNHQNGGGGTRTGSGGCDDEPEICIELLKMDLDQHKQALIDTLADRAQQLYERDCTIKTQCFHIVTMNQTIEELMKERSRLDETVTDLRKQFEVLASHDWQCDSGIKKKRKLCPSQG
jgi:hypothetical protein